MKRPPYVLWLLIILALGGGVAAWGGMTGWPGKVTAILSSLQSKKEEAFSFRKGKG